MPRRSPEEYDTLEPLTEQPEYCTAVFPATDEFKEQVCGKQIKTMAYKGTGVCGDEHRKLQGKKIMGEK